MDDGKDLTLTRRELLIAGVASVAVTALPARAVRTHGPEGAIMMTKNLETMRNQGPQSFAPPIADLVGIRAVCFEEGQAVLELDADNRHASTCLVLRGDAAKGR